jgi:hypothetical protein
LAMGLDVFVAVKCGGIAGAAVFPCLEFEGEEEQPIRVKTSATRKNQPSRIEFMMPY